MTDADNKGDFVNNVAKTSIPDVMAAWADCGVEARMSFGEPRP